MASQPLLSTEKLSEFNTPTNYRSNDYDAFFDLSPDAMDAFDRLTSRESKLAFLLAYCYCKAESRFFSAKNYPTDVLAAAVERYKPLTTLRSIITKPRKVTELKDRLSVLTSRHRPSIIKLLAKKVIDKNSGELKELDTLAGYHAEKQTGPELLFDTLVSACIERNWLVPSATVLMEIIGEHYRRYRSQLLAHIGNTVDDAKQAKLLTLLNKDRESGYRLTRWKNIEQSIRPRDLARSAKTMKEVKHWYEEYKQEIDQLSLNDQAVAYHAHWVHHTDVYQLKQLKTNDICLRLLCFLIDNHQRRQDAMLLSFLTKWRREKRRARVHVREKFLQKDSVETKLIAKSTSIAKTQSDTLKDIHLIINDDFLSDTEKVQRIENQLTLLYSNETPEEMCARAENVGNLIKQVNSEIPVFRRLAEDENRISKSLRPVLEALTFDSICDHPVLYQELCRYRSKQATSPDFLTTNTKKYWKELGPNDALKNILLFEEVSKSVNSGKLSLLYSFHFKRLGRLLLDDKDWLHQREELIAATNLKRFSNFNKIKSKYESQLDTSFMDLNTFLDDPECTDLAYTKNGRGKLIEKRKGHVEHSQTLSTLLYDVRGTMVTDVFRHVSDSTSFEAEFTHSSNQHAVRNTDFNQLIAAILSQGLNLGTRKMFDCSKGLKEASLMDAVRFRLTLENLKRANQCILDAIDVLPLSREFQKEHDVLRSSSDGQKYLVTRDSLVSAYSYKYFGQESGVARYIYVDEKNRVFSSRVFMPSKREATYVLDGLASNISDIPRMHSTDTHGFTEPVFACCALMGVRFAPRIADIHDQVLSGHRSPSWYEKEGYHIRPTHKINWKLIESQWDEILRFMASILSGKCLASQLFNRLNSYAADHPLYKALKELGRVEKTLFILRYYRHKTLRDDIQKQLNIGEHMNKFQKAVTWGDGKRLRGQSIEEYERAAACTQLIQNSIIYWNYLYATERLGLINDLKERESLRHRLSRGQMIAWGHINLTGTFIFKPKQADRIRFNARDLAGVDLGNPISSDYWGEA